MAECGFDLNRDRTNWLHSTTFNMLLETCIQASYQGTSYKPANWICLGMANGFAVRRYSIRYGREPVERCGNCQSTAYSRLTPARLFGSTSCPSPKLIPPALSVNSFIS